MAGGSSAINFSVAMYPSRANFEAWESLSNDGWGLDTMAPYLQLLTEIFVRRVILAKDADGQVTAFGIQIRTKDGER
jgi:choline dehydrogenase-like flavoprotein